MAILMIENLKLEIDNLIGYSIGWKYEDSNEPVIDYESFNLKITCNGEKVFNNIKKTKYELLDGNIKTLLKTMKDMLDGKKEYDSIEFEEPDFEFEFYRCKDNYIIEGAKELYELVIWFDSAQWNHLYSGTSVGCKISMFREDFFNFYEELKFDYENRRIIPYDKKEKI